jgi:hypothetical protein
MVVCFFIVFAKNLKKDIYTIYIYICLIKGADVIQAIFIVVLYIYSSLYK